MKTIFLFTMLLSSCASVLAMNIKGRVIDSDSQPIEFANVSAFVNDSIVGGCVTDSIDSFQSTGKEALPFT